jgi:hypothetical protein
VLQGFTLQNGATARGAVADQFNGAGILCTQGSSPTIRDMVITGSWAGCWGGAICCSMQSHPLVDRCVITANYSNDDGGGLFAWSGSNPTVMNCSITGNTSRVTGGGITTFGGSASFTNCTIVGNAAPFGAGVYTFAGANFANSIVWGNDGALEVEGDPSISYSLVGGGYAGTGNVDTVPNFVDVEGGDYHLAANSPLINVGDPDYKPGPGETDNDGNARVVDGRIDMGAFEFQGVPCRADISGNGTIDFADLVSVLAAWGGCSGCPEDVDVSGEVDFADIVTLLARWGPCPG